ncbi:MAG TPA: AAA family ATPase, partial [Christiangramia sp.]|nr:AAA family ATPase [Christiangramia sp.]
MATKTHRTDDHILNILTNTDGLLSEFVNAYPGKYAIDNDADWLDDWFKSRTDHFLINASEGQKIPFDIDTLVDDVLSRQATVVKKQATIISITPHYFRGFRNLSVPINLTGKLVVIDGRNSSGKTSLAEAFEWLFTGQLIRRSLGDMGDSKELENCIGNQLRPDEENTWVEVEFSVGNNETLKIKRILTEDYSEKKTSKAKSNLLLNNLVLSRKDEEQLLDELFAGNPPVLMQHSLRTFVSSTPSQRRDYFERLLRLDELAYIIEKSVVGNSRLTDFPSKTGSVIWREWEELKNISDGNTVKILKKGEKVSDRLSGNLDEALQGYAKSVFNINNEDLSIEETGRALEELQKQSREKEFYLLDELRPQKTVDQQLLESFSTNRMNQLWSEFEPVALSYIETNTAAEKIGKAQIAIAAALEDLINAGLSIELHNAQTCPLCAYSETPTLTQPRISEIKSWQPIQKAAQNAIDKLNQELNKISAFVEAIRVDKNGLIPNNPSPEDWDKAVLNKSPQIREAALVCKNTLASCREQTEVFDTTLNNIIDLTKQNDSPDFINSMRIEFESLQSIFPIVLDKAHDYLDSFHSLETMIGKKSREDPIYNNRQIWISLSQKRDE